MHKEAIEGFRVSPQQRHLWSLQRYDGSQVYNARCCVMLEGELQPELLKASIDTVVNRHEILRTAFVLLPGMTAPLQTAAEYLEAWIEEHDLTALSLSDQEAGIDLIFSRLRVSEVKLDGMPALRAILVALSPFKHALVLSVPALCGDAIGLQNVVKEIAAVYAAGAENTETESMEYADVSEVLNDLLESEETKAGRDIWNSQDFRGLLALKLPFEKSIDGPVGFSPALHHVGISSALAEGIMATASRYEVSAQVLLMSCWQIFLSRLSGQAQFCLTTGCEGRAYTGLAEMPGLLTRFLPLQCDLADCLSVAEVTQQTGRLMREANRWPEYFAWDAIESPNWRDLEQQFHPVSFEFQTRAAAIQAGDIRFDISKQYDCLDRFKLKLLCVQGNDNLTLDIHFNESQFDRAEVESLGRRFGALLQSVVDNPEARAIDLELLDEGERQQLLVRFNDTAVDYPEKTFQHLFDEQARRTPDHVAVKCGEHLVTFAELNARSNQLGNHLQALGVGPDVPVAICVERSVEMLVGVLGVLKAGGAYVPLDHEHPAQRLAAILEEVKAPALVSQQLLKNRLPDNVEHLVLVDRWEDISGDSECSPPSLTGPDNLAYILYTSGSTGKPKGVMIPHRGLANYLQWCSTAYSVKDGSGTIVHSPLVFDLTVTSLLAPLMAGQTVTLVPEDDSIDGLAEALRDGGDATLIKITPAHLDLLSQSLSPEEAKGASRAFVVGGEALFAGTLDFWRTHSPGIRLINEYGPTETVVGCCVFEVPREGCPSSAVPIGRPIANTQLYVLDSRLAVAPLGVPGELFIGGGGVGRAYFKDALETARNFIPNPFGGEGSRMYRSGDLARYLRDGNLEYLGRIDNQVKIRGFRIELGEIEESINAYPSVRACAVLAREDEPGHRRLVAYVVYDLGSSPESTDLRAFLQKTLPHYMIPSAFVSMGSLPLTPNGKVDRRGLPGPERAQPQRERSYVPPRGAAEEALAEIWSKTLGVERVGAYDNFFELGGDSITSLQVIARAKQAGWRLNPKHFVQHQNIAALARAAEPIDAPRVEQGAVVGDVILTPIQHWYFEQELTDPHHYNQAVMLTTREPIEARALMEAARHLVSHHDALRMEFTRVEEGWRQVSPANGGDAEFIQVDQSALREDQARAVTLAAEQANRGFVLSNGPLIRIVLFDKGAGCPSNVLIVIHHLVVDGVSWRIILEDLQTAYDQVLAGMSFDLPAKTTSYKDWAQHLPGLARSSEVQSQGGYWLSAARRGATPLPVQNPAGINTAGSARSISVHLSPEETSELVHSVPEAFNARLEDVLLTALAYALASWTGQRTLLVDIEGHGRDSSANGIDITRTVGWFTTLFPALLEIDVTRGLDASLKSVKEQLRQIPERGAAYGLLRYLSGDSELSSQLSQMPQAQVVFNYLGRFDQSFETGLFKLADEPAGPMRSERDVRRHLLEINGSVLGGVLRFEWIYSEQIHSYDAIRQVADHFVYALRSLVMECADADAGGYTPSDFPLLDLNQDELDHAFAELEA